MPRLIRPIRVEGNIAYVPLTRGYEAIIDAVDVPLVEGRNWHVLGKPYRLYVATRDRTTRTKTYLHRVLLNAPVGVLVDHIDGNTLNNRRSNLRLATYTQNAQNTTRSPANTSGVVGVTWEARKKVWRADISMSGKGKFLGHFDTLEDAVAARRAAAARFFGEFAPR